MLVSLNWLTDYVDIRLSTAELCSALMGAGFNIESVQENDADVVIDLEVTSNRPDCLGHLGVAREIAAITGVPFNPPITALPPASGKASDLTRVDVHDSGLCPRYTARVIRGVHVGASPSWLVERLEAVGLRSINNIVDVTNFVLMEYSQPLHAFDLDKLIEQRIVVRRARDGETIVSIDGTTCRLDEQMLVIADAKHPVAVAGIMGGLASEVSNKTVNVLIESAQFDPLCIRRTSRRLQLASPSNYRFERGVDPVALDAASQRACKLIVDVAGGQLAAGAVDVWAKPWQAPVVTLRPHRTTAVLGVEIARLQQREILDRLGLGPRAEGDGFLCTIPSHRADLTREIDLIEEIIRLAGYDRIPVDAAVSHPVQPRSHVQRMRSAVSAVMSAAGFDEAVTFAFVDAARGALFGVDKPVCVDPLTRKTHNALRPTLLISLLEACKNNQDQGTVDLSLYELAAVFPPSGGALPAEHLELAMVTRAPLRDLRGAVEALAARLAPAAEVLITPADAAGMEKGQSAAVALDGKTIGHVGLVAADVLKAFDLEHAFSAAALDFEALVAASHKARPYRPVPHFPAVRRDLSVVVDEPVTWAQIAAAIGSIDQPLRVGLDYVTTYRGKPIEPGKKSLTLTLTYRSDAETLRSEQVDAQVAQIVSQLNERFAAQLRS
ncbi:MAG: phenylalanine--tRNA ligase subunit beta [Planctomycetaceae bacterium]|nr:phenylalanine--tRNA ligase subunit beta [Planctomycetaceae bacterium]